MSPRPPQGPRSTLPSARGRRTTASATRAGGPCRRWRAGGCRPRPVVRPVRPLPPRHAQAAHTRSSAGPRRGRADRTGCCRGRPGHGQEGAVAALPEVVEAPVREGEQHQGSGQHVSVPIVNCTARAPGRNVCLLKSTSAHGSARRQSGEGVVDEVAETSSRPRSRHPGGANPRADTVAPALLLHHGIKLRPARTDGAARRPQAVPPPCRVRVPAPASAPARRLPVTNGSATGCNTRSTQP